MKVNKENESLITQGVLKEYLHYNRYTGEFSWLKSNNLCVIGKRAGCHKPDGYVSIKLLGKHYQAHRLAWLYVYGYFPENILDHINRVRNDNRILNLREADWSMNMHNRSQERKDGKYPKGISFHTKTNKYRVRLQIDKVIYELGSYVDLEDAKLAREKGLLRFGL